MGVVLFAMPAARADIDTSWAQRMTASLATDDTAWRPGRGARAPAQSGGIADDPGEASRSGCIPARLAGVIGDVRAAFGPVRITSTCRSASANRAAGGAPRSLHLSGHAVDFRVGGSSRTVLAFLASHSAVGGYKAYRSGLYHIDTGPRRPM
jgi:hypothetical protein